MRVIKDQTIVEDDWRLLADDEAVPPKGDIIVSFDRWLVEKASLLEGGSRVGICVKGEHDLDAVVQELDSIDLVALDFPVFSDGRNYSNARLLRERYSYTGELRAVGDVLRDQLFYMARCGIDSFAVAADKDIDDALQGLKDFTVTYQPASDEAVPVFRLRR